MHSIPQDDIPKKTCTKCERSFPATPKFFNRHRDGLKPRCKKCTSEDNREYNESHKEQIQSTGKAYHAANRERENAGSRAYRKENAEVVNARRRDNYSVEREKRLASGRRSYERRKDAVKVQHHEYYIANRIIFRTRDANRRAIECNIQGSHTAMQIRQQYDRQKGKCYYCHKRVKWGKRHVDHTFPLSRVVGTDIPANSIDYLVISCAPCNMSKGDKFPWEWPEGGRLL